MAQHSRRCFLNRAFIAKIAPGFRGSFLRRRSTGDLVMIHLCQQHSEEFELFMVFLALFCSRVSIPHLNSVESFTDQIQGLAHSLGIILALC
jgi:hypothetical protein